jgi:hypothetical protein
MAEYCGTGTTTTSRERWENRAMRGLANKNSQNIYCFYECVMRWGEMGNKCRLEAWKSSGAQENVHDVS